MRTLQIGMITVFLSWAGMSFSTLEAQNLYTPGSLVGASLSGTNVGVGTNNPVALLEVNNGAMLCNGAVGATPVAGAGTRLMWVPDRTAFRAGRVTGTQWDNANIGTGSIAMGIDATATGISTVALGETATASGNYAVSTGWFSNATGEGAWASGAGTLASGQYSAVTGFLNKSTGVSSTAMGQQTQASGDYSTATGWFTLSTGTASFCSGALTNASGDYSTAMGQGSVASGGASTAIGNVVTSSFSEAVALGSFLTSSASASMAIGKGIDNANRLINNTANSLMIGYLSDVPTVFVGPSSGSGTTGDVGIGTASPNAKLHVSGGAFLADGTSGSTPASGAGTRMMWVPDKSSFRAGIVTNADWDAANIGLYSVGFGEGGRAYGDYSSTFGWECDAADFAFAAGAQCEASSTACIALGDLAVASGSNSQSIGNGSQATGLFSLAMGTNVRATNTQSMAIGVGVSTSSRMTNSQSNSLAVGFNSDIPTFFVGGASGVGTVGRVGVGTTAPSATLDVVGTGFINGMAITSDKRYKNNIETIESGLDKVMALRGTTYEYNNENGHRNNFREGLTYGFIAQEVKEVLPELVWEDEDGYYAVNYDGVLPVLVEAIKELNDKSTENAELEDRLTAMEQELEALKNLLKDASGSDSSIDITPEDEGDKNEASLSQNAPNPFENETIIGAYIPDHSSHAELVIHTLAGKEIHRETLLQRGQAQIRISGDKLQKGGQYLYSLIIDGEKIDTKKMILAN